MGWRISTGNLTGRYSVYCTQEKKYLLLDMKPDDLIAAYGARMKTEGEEYMRSWIEEVRKLKGAQEPHSYENGALIKRPPGRPRKNQDEDIPQR